MAAAARTTQTLPDGATVAIVGGGPAGSFLAIHLLRLARARRQDLRVVIFERRRPPPRDELGSASGPYKGCPRCAGGVSPRLSDALAALDIHIPDEVRQMQIRSIAVQGHWKPIYLQVPEGRHMLSVYRGTLPIERGRRQGSFDAVLLDVACRRGARLVGRRVTRVYYDRQRRPVVRHEADDGETELTADFVAFAGGVNESSDPRVGRLTCVDLFRMLQPDYEPPRLRKSLIVELEAPPECIELTEGQLHYVEGSGAGLRLEMCSVLPKRGYFTISLVGRSVDEATSHRENLDTIRRFIKTPQMRRILPADAELRIRCICNPHVVVGNSRYPCAERAAAVGDMATSRQYKDGILAAHDMARDLATAIVERGTALASLAAGYEPTLRKFRRDNRFASVIFFLYRWFFTHSSPSRIIYQSFATERKLRQRDLRSFERIFWAISSGDDSYEEIARAMLRPSTLWKIVIGGGLITLRNWLTELFFGLDWRDIGRFPTAVPVERLRELRRRLRYGRESEFECMYTIHMRASAADARRLMADFGENSRPYLHPRWVSISRDSGRPLNAGWTIRYRVFGGLLSFAVVQVHTDDPDFIHFRVRGGFADAGSFIFLIEPEGLQRCALTVYLAFDYARGRTLPARVFWRVFRALFPEYLHDVLWNHALCEFKQAAETDHTDPAREPPVPMSTF